MVLMGVNGLDPINDNVDVEIKMDDGRVYSATFFTMENIKRLLQRWQTTGGSRLSLPIPPSTTAKTLFPI